MRDSELIKKDITKFLQLCISYSEKSIGRKYQRKQNMQHDDEIKVKLEKEIEKWESYKEFTEYTIHEIEKGMLDHWIENLHNTDFNPEPRGVN